MFKNKVMLITLIIPVAAVFAVIAFAAGRDSDRRQSFDKSGYILVSPDTTYSKDVNTQVYFEQGTGFKARYADKVVFKNQRKENVVVDSRSFVHYNDGSIRALSRGVLIDLNDLENSLTNHYGLSTESSLEKSGNGFILDNLGDSMNFSEFLWKISDSKYLLGSEKISIYLSNNNVQEFRDYVELTYYDTGIIRVVTQEGAWQTVSADCVARLNNGVAVNLANKTIVKSEGEVALSLEQLVIDSDDNIQIIPEGKNDIEFKVPEFDIQTVDGTNGKSGNAGEAGEAGKNGQAGAAGEQGEQGEQGAAGTSGTPGKPGEAGKTGTTGINGSNGSAGSSGGNGAAGANGAQGKNGDVDEYGNPIDDGSSETVTATLPAFELTSLETKSGSVSASIAVSDTENSLDVNKPFTIQILENSTGREIYRSETESSSMNFDVKYSGLSPNCEYRLLLSADYIVENVNYSRIFLNKLFNTDSTGLEIEKYFSSNNSLAFNVSKKSYSEITGADLQISDKDGNPLDVKTINLVSAESADGDTVIFEGLKSNSLYKIKVVNIQMGYDSSLVVPPEFIEKEFRTLKLAPTLGKPAVVVNRRNGCFDMKLESVSDLDAAIIGFRYEIYEAVPGSSDGKLVKTLSSTSNELIPCYVDGTDIKNGYNYRLKVVAECFDNEKRVEYSSAYSDLFGMTGNAFPTVLFEKDRLRTHHEKITGTLRINTNGSILKVNAENPLIISYQNSKGDSDSYQMTDIAAYQLADNNNTLYNIPFTEGNLLADDNYIISVYGTLDLNDGAGFGKRNHVGSVIVNTDKPAAFMASLKQENNQVHPIAFCLSLLDADPQASSEYEASTMQYLEINIYNGDEKAVPNSSPVATYTILGKDGNNYKSTIKDDVYGENNYLLITEQEFKINPAAISSSKYTVEVSSVRDYTRYGNKFEVKNNIKTFTKSATLPNLDDIDINDGLLVIPVTKANITQYVQDPALLAQYDKYDANIIFGYDVCAAYFDNSSQLVDSFIYYAFEEADYRPGNNAQDFYSGANPLASVEKQVSDSSGGVVPNAVFLFGADVAKDMSRGSKFVFTYRAKLKIAGEQGETLYFPDNIDSSVIIRSKTAAAPYQIPRFRLYPWLSDSDSMIWKYSVHAPDPAAVVGSFYLTGQGAPSAISNEIQVTGLNNGDSYTLKQRTRQFNSRYGDISENILASQFFESVYSLTKDTTTLSYIMEDMPSQNRCIIKVKDSAADASHLSRIVAVNVKVYKSRTGSLQKSITVPVDSVTGDIAVCYLKYSELEQYVGNTLYYTVNAVYDNGIYGFAGPDGKNCAIQTMPGVSRGNYISLNYNHDGIMEDISGNAKGSYFRIKSMNNQTASLTLTYDSVLDESYKDEALNITCEQTGARLENLGSRPLVSLKGLGEVLLARTDFPLEEFTEYELKAFTPTITLNRGAAYTIETTFESAAVSWILNGHDAQIDCGNITNPVMYIELFKIDAQGVKEPTGRIIEAAFQKGASSYVTEIDNLAKNTKYGIQFYYMDKDGGKVYPIDSYRPDVVPSTVIFTFTTNDKVIITPGLIAIRYVANEYADKYLQLNYSLNQTIGFKINYSLCKKTAGGYTEVLSGSDLSSMNIIQSPVVYKETMQDERIMLRPGGLYWNEDGARIYFPFDSADYFICLKPVSKTNPDIMLGEPQYISLRAPGLSSPFYNVRAVPDENKVTFHISILDSSKVMVNGHYKVKVLNGSDEDITPAACRDVVYSINNPVSITLEGIPKDDSVALQIYSVYDMKNTGLSDSGEALKDIGEIAYGSLDGSFLKASYTGRPLGDRGYDLGDVQIVQTSGELARIYFINAVNLSRIKYIKYVVVNEGGTNTSYSEPFTPVLFGNDRYYYEMSHRFASKGIYQIQARFYDETMSNYDDIALTFFKNF